MEEYDVLYPLLSYDRFGAEYRWHLFQVLNFSGGQSQEEKRSDKFTIFPFYFQRRSADPTQNYTALLPFWGTLKDRLLRDEIKVRLFPLYARTVKKDVVTENYAFPFVHLRHGTQLRTLHVHHDLPGLEPRNGQQVLDEKREPVRVLLDGS